MQQPQSQQPSPGTGGAASELRSDAHQIGNSAANRLHSEVDSRKGEAAGQARSVSNAIQRAAGELDQGTPSWLRSAFQQGADHIQRFADTLEQKDSRELMREAESFARQRPGAFLAACAAAGFAVARVFKAGGQQPYQPLRADDRSQNNQPSDTSRSAPVTDDPLILGSGGTAGVMLSERESSYDRA
ncbi:MAG: hypothetical protein ACJ8EY_08390 [Sphingomicrobium sp.]